MRQFRGYINRTTHLSRVAIVPIFIGIGVSGCVSTDASLTSQLAPTTVGLVPLDDTLTPQDTASLGYNGSIPVPDSSTDLASSYNSVPEQNVATAAAQSITTTPASINALDKNGQIYIAQTPNTDVANPQVASLATATPASTSLARPSKDGNAFFSSLFKRPAKPKPARAVDAAPAQKPTVQQVAAVTPVVTPEVKKPQITSANKVTLASATPVSSERASAGKEKKRGIFSSIFGSKDKNKSKNKNRVQLASAAGLARLSPLTLQRQTERVDVACFKPELVRLLKKVEKHYKKPVVVTSGYRSPQHNKRIGGASGSRHTTCEAADVQIKGVTKWELAKFVRSMSDRGGVGTYCHTQSVHIDIGSVRDWNWRCRKRKR